MITSKQDILEKLKVKFGDDTSDDTLAIIEDITDTFDDFEAKTKDNTDWSAKYKELDESWRKKYRDRFYAAVDGDGHDMDKFEQLENQADDEETIATTYEDLFKED